MAESWFYELDSGWVVLFIGLAMMLAAEIGYRAGRARHEKAGDMGRDHFSDMLCGVLGLLALLLGFTFDNSADGYHSRQQLVMDDALAINTVYLQSMLLPEAQRVTFQRILRQYVDERASLKPGMSVDETKKLVTHAGQLLKQMWSLTVSMTQANPEIKNAEALLPLLSNAQAIHERRVFAYRTRVPSPVLILLLGTSIFSMCVVGYAAGLGLYRSMFARVMLTFLVCGTIFVILELDQPRHGLLKIDQTPILHVGDLIDQALGGVQ